MINGESRISDKNIYSPDIGFSKKISFLNNNKIYYIVPKKYIKIIKLYKI